MVREISPTEFVATLATSPATLLVDVREDWELEIARVPGVLHIPMGEIPDRLAELDRGRDLVILCKAGGAASRSRAFWRPRATPRSPT